ncbi:subclass B3 metallo-beta-lactamase [Aurantiacibacter poecillastricola]|uniref:subclass B3 metallo-beta-lactamase n=1 Tax=Aurantiacibacter poecillastricola TaxID=3064385 RepID=UPI00273D110A|nr:subclass B3 metallo-beta-lactamase [Aurantiacibacter sp. 219JJ12-13]MDP5261822.1 subclass B3 metallo-beta-lactamase [Aurantiacibacter sp. 219JJ12-13]
MEAARSKANEGAAWADACTEWDDWDKRSPPFRVHGDTYHVGTCGISAILVAGSEGHVLLDSGTRDGARVVLSNIRTLGFQPQNVRAVLTSHEHFDHVGGLWWINQNTGAQIFTAPAAVEVLQSGKPSRDDPQAASLDPMRPLEATLVSAVEPGEPLVIAGLTFTPIATPGHTPGALSWQWQSCEDGECRTIVYADSLSPISSEGYRFSDNPAYVAAYREGLARLAATECDILLTPHPSASGMRGKILADDMGTGKDCRGYAEDRLAMLEERLAQEQAQ